MSFAKLAIREASRESLAQLRVAITAFEYVMDREARYDKGDVTFRFPSGVAAQNAITNARVQADRAAIALRNLAELGYSDGTD